MKKYYIKLLFILFIHTSSAQVNLVSNPSFESIDSCPDYVSQINRAIGWYTSMGTSDYFNSCANAASFVSVPLNWAGYRTPASGNGYSGIIARWANTDALKEAIGTQLSSPLQIGIKYYASFKVSLGGQENHFNWCGINKIGILFSTVPYDSITNATTCNNCAQICSDSIITDTLNWTMITGSFIADSVYSYISIGRFNYNSLTDSIQIAGTGCNAYYYIDDVCISEDSLYAYNYIFDGIKDVNEDESLVYFPNPTKDLITIEAKYEKLIQIQLFDIMGKFIRSYSIDNLEKYNLNLEDLSKGIYNLIIYRRNRVPKNLKIIKI